jgi:hypothetical protein
VSDRPGVGLLLFATTAVIFFVTGAAYRSFDQTGETSQVSAAPVLPAQTVVVVVNMPDDPTPTRTPLPTVAPTQEATVDVRINDCDRGTRVPGDVCVSPPEPTATDIPIPECPVDPGHWCRIPMQDETTSRTESE